MDQGATDPQSVTDVMPITLLYTDNCPACERAKPRVIEFCKARSIPLVVRKPRLSETRFLTRELGRIPSFPTMLVPLEQVVIICGDQAADWLAENEQKVCDGYGISNRNSDDPDQGVARR